MTLHRPGDRFKPWLATIIVVMSVAAQLCQAAPKASVGVSGGLEAFREKEFDSNGSRLVKESGNRFVTTAFLDYGDNDFKKPVYSHLEASAYWGKIDYDGFSQSPDPNQNNQPLKSKTVYLGGRTEAILGYRISAMDKPRGIALIGGLGIDAWNRTIRNSTASNGTLVSGIEETYTVYYGKLGLELTNLFHPIVKHSRLQFGIKLPFYISEYINLSQLGYNSDLTLSPGITYSGFIKLQLEPRFSSNATGNYVIGVYYDGFRFNPSKSKTVSYNGSPVQVWQPETQTDSLGINIGYRF